ncbi:MAG: S8 family serine peptidase, partial [Acidobacteriota bacterium]
MSQLNRPLLEKLMFGSGRARRFTQDSPVLPDVWLAYAGALDEDNILHSPRGALQILLTPFRKAQPGMVRNELASRIQHPDARVIYNQSTVLADLTFEELIQAVLPMTSWWAKLTDIDTLQDHDVQKLVARGARDPENPESQFSKAELKDKKGMAAGVAALPPDVFWLVRVVGALALALKGDPLPELFAPDIADQDWLPVVKAVAALVKKAAKPPDDPMVYVASLNRSGWTSVRESALSVKADAARQLFSISCKDIRWAVIDGGIEARHPAFRIDTETPAKEWSENTRVVETYDFTRLEQLLAGVYPERIAKLRKAKSKAGQETAARIERLEAMVKSGETMDWRVVGPFIRMPHDDEYETPIFDHGTHVAGILAANWPEQKLKGLCPDIRLYDIRVVGPQGVNEFTLMAAMQFLQWINSAYGVKEVHGANISLSIRHDVSNYACGRTPVCDEAERLVASGVVVVAAAGNYGYRRYVTPEGPAAEAYNTISIVDPGNAEGVITVGATHRTKPHTYGVSYFSSRGPTGDGRLKPDLVAPGEKIIAPIRDDTTGVKDGTSMAAPHVSGAAALLMARHQELIGQP